MHTNGIITDMTGGLLGTNSATPQLPRSPLVGSWLTCSSYLGIRDNRPPFVGNVLCVLGIISGMIRYTPVFVAVCNVFF